MSCSEAGWYRWYRLAAATIASGGGCAMIVGAVLARSSTLSPLLLIGSGWILLGVIFASQGWLVREIVIAGEVARFISVSECIDVPAGDIIEIGHGSFDPQRMGTLRIETVSNGTIKAVPRLDGLFEVVAELRRLNPTLMVENL